MATESRLPLPPIPARVIAAPMAGGPSTPDLVAAVSDAGGLGILAAGYLAADAVLEQIRAVRARSAAPFGVNVFAPVLRRADEVSRVPAYADSLRATAQAMGAEPGQPKHTDDDYAAKVAVLVAERPALAAFTFGLPDQSSIDRLHAAGIPVLATVTGADEAVRAEAAGCDGLVVQGWEAGAHRGGLDDTGNDEQPGLLPLLRLVRNRVDLPLIAAGGIADGPAVAAVLAAGAYAAMLGTAFLRCPEAGTSPIHAAALAEAGPTVITRAFTGRRARALPNAFTAAHSAQAPAAYPEVHYLTAPIRAAARRAGDRDNLHLWAGEAHELARPIPAADLVRGLARDARRSLQEALGTLGG